MCIQENTRKSIKVTDTVLDGKRVYRESAPFRAASLECRILLAIARVHAHTASLYPDPDTVMFAYI